jgi:hypothetical protein
LHTPSLRLQALAERRHAVAAIATTAKSTASAAVATTTVATSSTTGVSAAASAVAATATKDMLANVHVEKLMREGTSTLLQQVRDRPLDLQQVKQARSPNSICAQKVMSKEK